MSVVRQTFPGISRADTNDRTAQTNLVRLSDADRVQDDRDEIAFRRGPRDTSSMFVFETNLQAARNAPSADDAVERVSPSEDGWSGLDVEQTLGQLMTETRKHLGLSRDQVSEQTHIPAYYVRMIESDSYDAIPDQLYLLPFFRRYADFLGLDAQKVVSRFICDFEKAENEVVESPPAPTAYSKALLKWRQIAAAAVIGAILLPCIAWAVGAMRVAYRRPADSSSVASLSPGTRPSTAIASTDARSMAAQDHARTPDAVAASRASVPTALAETNAGSQVAPQVPAQIKQTRTGRRHRLIRHSRRWRQRHLMYAAHSPA
jgi:cytoskeletal protein RodZ